MHRFKIIPCDGSDSGPEVVARDAGAVLNVVDHIACHEADVMLDGEYSFSVRLSAHGLWTIYQQSLEDRAASDPTASSRSGTGRLPDLA